jgi:hypothetical protein
MSGRTGIAGACAAAGAPRRPRRVGGSEVPASARSRAGAPAAARRLGVACVPQIREVIHATPPRRNKTPRATGAERLRTPRLRGPEVARPGPDHPSPPRRDPGEGAPGFLPPRSRRDDEVRAARQRGFRTRVQDTAPRFPRKKPRGNGSCTRSRDALPVFRPRSMGSERAQRRRGRADLRRTTTRAGLRRLPGRRLGRPGVGRLPFQASLSPRPDDGTRLDS